jgi:uncharacterized protein with ParB-like and HNH nuclease domain
MKATEARLLDFLKKSPQFVIPIYQRTYSWTDRECRQLWDDILRTGSKDAVSAHFIGSIVYIEKGLYQVSSQSPLLVIDGQQRLTTISLLIAALAKALDRHDEGGTEPVDGFSPRKLRNYYLLNPEEEGQRHYNPDRQGLSHRHRRRQGTTRGLLLTGDGELQTLRVVDCGVQGQSDGCMQGAR